MVSLPLLPVTLLALLAGTMLPLKGDTAKSATPLAPTPQHLNAIVAHGPWPVTPGPDPSNPVSGQAAAIEFGYRMFREPRMSANGYVTCV
ncbi:MAG TPA: hypothetical protein VMN83_15900, partial [Albitalea sp.]|nr:hypothetical protein [Albitalea sp.]